MHHPAMNLGVLTGIVFFIEGGFLLGAVGMYAASISASAQVKRERWVKFVGYLLIVHFMIAIGLAGRTWFAFLCVAIAVGSVIEFTTVTIKSGLAIRKPRAVVLASILLMASLSGAIAFAFHTASSHGLYLYVIVAVLDAYSQIVGQLIGRHRLAPGISPTKTIEGAAGGALVAMLAAVCLRGLAGRDLAASFFLGAAVCACGIAGDLLASWYKRLNNVKDFGTILPGQGGVIDRFNGFLLAAPVFWALDAGLCSSF